MEYIWIYDVKGHLKPHQAKLMSSIYNTFFQMSLTLFPFFWVFI